MTKPGFYKKILAVTTAGISILIGILYLLLITLMDARGPMIPPPPEAFGAVVTVSYDSSLTVQLLYSWLPQEIPLRFFPVD
tara:strand:- start:19 stop:261 length:243 start_codon:yes stop_codon:yes gene_type:complete